MPLGLWTRGFVLGLLAAMLAVGMALIYRANRVVNFAQADLGTVPTGFAAALILFWQWPYLIGLGVGMLIAVLLGLVVEMAIIRRFRNAAHGDDRGDVGRHAAAGGAGHPGSALVGQEPGQPAPRIAARLEADVVGQLAPLEARLQQVHPRRQRHHRDDRRAVGAVGRCLVPESQPARHGHSCCGRTQRPSGDAGHPGGPTEHRGVDAGGSAVVPRAVLAQWHHRRTAGLRGRAAHALDRTQRS